MRNRKNKRKKNKKAIETHTWLRGPRRGGFSLRLETHPNPNLNLNILERPDER
jgi:hypothetical protein